MGCLVLVGRSGSGKTSVKEELCRRYGYSSVVTCTTRPPRVGEVNGVHYHFMSKEDFLQRKSNKEFVETAEYAGNLYGTLLKSLDVDENAVIILEPSGAAAVKKALGDRVLTVFLDVDRPTCEERLRKRGDAVKSICHRLQLDDTLYSPSTPVIPPYDVHVANIGSKLSISEVADAVVEALKTAF